MKLSQNRSEIFGDMMADGDLADTDCHRPDRLTSPQQVYGSTAYTCLRVTVHVTSKETEHHLGEFTKLAETRRRASPTFLAGCSTLIPDWISPEIRTK